MANLFESSDAAADGNAIRHLWKNFSCLACSKDMKKRKIDREITKAVRVNL